jgi:P27 family predicted phage terminase small subunit
MAKRGPKPQNPQLRVVHGNPGKRPPAKVGRGPAAARPKMPAWLGKVAKAKWRALIPQLEQLGILTAVDGDVLAAYCLAWEELQEATHLLQVSRTICRGSGALAAHPAVAMQRSAWKAVEKFAALLGLNPHARRGWLEGNQEEETDPLKAWEAGDDKPA